jgi:hypothetical protein
MKLRGVKGFLQAEKRLTMSETPHKIAAILFIVDEHRSDRHGTESGKNSAGR